MGIEIYMINDYLLVQPSFSFAQLYFLFCKSNQRVIASKLLSDSYSPFLAPGQIVKLDCRSLQDWIKCGWQTCVQTIAVKKAKQLRGSFLPTAVSLSRIINVPLVV